MYVLGIETSCDECSAAIVENGKKIISHVIATQFEFHKPFNGVVPEIASRKHIEAINAVVSSTFEKADMQLKEIDAVAVTFRPGLIGSLLVGLSYAKGLALALDIPFIGIDHVHAHLYAPHLEKEINFPYIGLLLSGGHTIIARVDAYEDLKVLGTTIDDACGEAFDKVAKFYNLGYPGGVAIDKLAKKGDPKAFSLPKPSLHKGDHRYDVSYSGLKTATINQLDQFWNKEYDKTPENISASFQRAAIDMIVDKVLLAVKDTSIKLVVSGGGVSANSYLRESLNTRIKTQNAKVVFPSLSLCTDNGAMIAGLAYHSLKQGKKSNLNLNAEARVPEFRRLYP